VAAGSGYSRRGFDSGSRVHPERIECCPAARPGGAGCRATTSGCRSWRRRLSVPGPRGRAPSWRFRP
jgi:hypothetical protein